MAVIGVYDSGIGGLTTVKRILNEFIGNDIYYYADNLHHPFGNTDEDKLKGVIENGIKHVRAHSDTVVLACNTASSVTDDADVIRLLPPINEFACDAQNTLILATARTLSKLNAPPEFKVADTKELATLIEIQASLTYLKGKLDMSELLPYIAMRLHAFKGVRRVILGCSHYLFCKEQITKVLGDVEFCDGNDNLCEALKNKVYARPLEASKITYDFSAMNEQKKYDKILKIIMSE